MRETADGGLRLGYPAKIDGQRPRAGDAFPGLGEHTDAVLQELGVGTELSPGERRRGGVGKAWSLKRWANKVAIRWASRKA